MGIEPTIENVVISKILCNLPMEHWHVISTWDNILKAMKTFQNLTVRLLKIVEGGIIDEVFCKTRK
jgi:hypothetical protein